MKRFLTLAFILGYVTTSSAQTVDVTDENAWTIVQDVDAVATFGFDYSSFGIPAAPGSDDTLGLRLEANLVDPGGAAAISVSPVDLSLAGRYRIEVDVWMNYFADAERNGTTEFGGVFVGFDQGGDPINGIRSTRKWRWRRFRGLSTVRRWRVL